MPSRVAEEDLVLAEVRVTSMTLVPVVHARGR